MLYRGVFRELPESFFLALALLFLLSLAPVTNASAYYSLIMDASTSVTAPPVILQTGTAGTSTIYTNNTSAKVSVDALNWLSGWDKRVKITVNSSDIDETLVDFPVLVYLSNSSSGENNDNVSFIFDELDSDRKKIAVTTSDAITQCFVEIERWDDSREQAWLWVKIPNISNTTDTALYLYYDKDKADNIAYVDDTASGNSTQVWDSNFKAVLHLNQTPSGLADEIKDSTSYTNHGTTQGSMNSTDLVNAKIGSGLEFDEIDDLMRVPNSTSLSFSKSSGMCELWINWANASDGDNQIVMASSNRFTVGAQDGFEWASQGSGNHFFYPWGGNGNNYNLGPNPFTNGVWHHLAVTYLYATKEVKIYVDAASMSFTTENVPTYWTQLANTADWLWGGNPDRPTRYFDGIFDEIRIHSEARIDAWIEASYETGRDDLLDFSSEEINIEDYVDNNTSDVGSPSDRGTHSNFTAQQYGPDLIYDTLAEADSGTGSITYENSAESYSTTGRSSHNFNYALQRGSGDERLVAVTVSWEDAEASATISSLTFGGTAMTKVTDVTVGTGYSEYISLWYLLDSSLPGSPGSYNIAVTVSQSITREIYVAVAEYSGVKQSAPDDYDTHANTASGNTAITLTAAANGSVVVAGVGESGTNVLTNTNNINNLQLQLLTSSGSALGHHTDVVSGNITVGWNNLNTREGMAGAIWQPSKTSYEIDLEVQWTNASYTLSHEELCVKTGTTNEEDIRVDVWNGSEWINVFTALTPNSWNNVSVSSYLTSSNFTIRFKGSNEINDRTQDSWSIDATQLYVWTSFEASFDYVLKVNNTVTNAWQIRLKEYSSSNINRLQNCTIYFHNSSDGTSNQVVIENGGYTQDVGPWYDLGDSETIYMAMAVEANSTGTSYVYVYLEVLIPGTTTHAQYIISFEIT